MSDAQSVTFGQWLKQQRKSHGLTQEELADRIGCAFETIRKIEAGRRRPSRQMAELIAEIVGVPQNEWPMLVDFARATSVPVDGAIVPGFSVMPPAWEAHIRLPKRNVHIPAQRTTFVGREHEVTRVSNLLSRAEVRLIKLTGPPGIGKTRLGLQVADRFGDRFEDGTYFVALASTGDPNMVAPVIARTLGLKDVSKQLADDTLKTYLRGKEMLLLLDNFEHLLPAAPLLADLLIECPELKLLVTSRASLHLYGEYQVAVPPLAMPDQSAACDEELADMAGYEAIDLFMQRARSILHTFSLTDRNVGVIAEICRQLDGLPLAIELASARIQLMPPESILEHLVSRLKLLTWGASDLPPRQQTLRAAIAWSYDLLDDADRAFFRRFSVFVGSVDQQTIEAVCGQTGDENDSGAAETDSAGDSQHSTLERIGSLLDKSLLRRTDGPDGQPRFWMLWTIREYAAGRLAVSDEESAVRRRHARTYMRLVEQAEPNLKGPKRGEWLQLLEIEIGNIRAALGWCFSTQAEEDDRQTGLRIAGALHWFWYFRGYLSEGRAWIEQALSCTNHNVHTLAMSRALDAAGRLALLQEDYRAILSRLEESVTILRELDDRKALAYALTDLSIARVYRDRDPDAGGFELVEEAIGTFRALEENWGLAFALDIKADITLLLSGAEDEAARYRAESLALYRALGDDWGVGTALSELGYSDMKLGDYEAARAKLEEAVVLTRSTGDKWYTAISLRTLGDVAVEQANLGLAEAYYRESLALYQELGDKVRASNALRNLGHVARQTGDNTGAERHYIESMKLAREVGNLPNIALCLLGLAGVISDRGRPDAGVRLLGAANALREKSRGIMPPPDLAEYNRNIKAARAALDAEIFSAAWDQGRRLSLDEAIAFARSTAGPGE